VYITVHYTLYSDVHCTVYSDVQCTVYITVHCAVYSDVHCAVYGVHHCVHTVLLVYSDIHSLFINGCSVQLTMITDTGSLGYLEDSFT